MNRGEALDSIKANIENEATIKHMLATEAIMRALAARFGEDADEWGLAGLLHDIDIELCAGDMTMHSRKGADMLVEMGIEPSIVKAVLTHNEAHGVSCVTRLEKALFCADPLTGLITAGALIRPDKQLSGVELKSIRKRFKEKSFAAGANREQIASCDGIGLELEEFLEIGLRSMQAISAELGL